MNLGAGSRGDEIGKRSGNPPFHKPGHREYIISSLVLTGAPCGGLHHLCFTRDESEAQKGEVTYPRSHSP